VPLPAYLAALLIGLTAAFGLMAFAVDRISGGQPALRYFLLAAASAIYGVALLESTSAVLLADRLAGESTARALFAQVFDGSADRTRAANTANYVSHHYLDFALNPGLGKSGKRHIDPHYRIRRAEALRPRAQVAWRALVLGGSTTYGELIAREEDTWVYRLEQKMRAAHGADYDVVNGGVGGYNVIENFIHYLLLLDELEPDVVILYIGINDVHPRLIGDIEPDYSNSRIAWRGDSSSLPIPNPSLASFATYRLLLLRSIEQRQLAHLYLYVQRPYPPLNEWPAALQRNGTDVYRRHFRNLARLIRAEGRRVVVVPQVFVPRTDKRHQRLDEIFAEGVREDNDVDREVARELGLPFVEEAATAFGSADLIDNCHFNVAGSEKMAELISRFLESERVTAPHASPPP
jgi:lysophospholipase L1-like esterase